VNPTSLAPDSGPGLELARARLVAVLVLDDPESAVPLAQSLLEGGVRAMELTLRTPAALEAAERILAELPEMMVGIGTVLNADQVKSVQEIGAAFAVAPATRPEIIRLAHSLGLPFGPGVMTPGDIDLAVAEGVRLLKYFPAESSGGLRHLKQIAAPFAHLGVRYLPLGGITLENVASYFESELVAAVGGSWLAPREAIQARDWGRITSNAHAAMARIG